MVFLTAGFARVFPEERLELKSLKGQTKAEELGARCPELLSLRLRLQNTKRDTALNNLDVLELYYQYIYTANICRCE